MSLLNEVFITNAAPKYPISSLIADCFKVTKNLGYVKITNHTYSNCNEIKGPYLMAQEITPKFYIYKKMPDFGIWVEYSDKYPNEKKCYFKNNVVLSTESHFTQRLRTRITSSCAYRIGLFDANDKLIKVYNRGDILFTTL